MIIYVVQEGDTISSIAEQYQVPAARLSLENGIDEFSKLVPGETIVIAYPKETYTVQEGDTLAGIAESRGISLIQLLRNNPYLSDREFIYPGEVLVIRYDNSKGSITTNGFVNTFVDIDTLKRTLPFLSYLSVFGYRTTENAEIIGIDDDEIIRLAKEYKVAPIMLLSTLTPEGVGSVEISYKLLYNQNLVDKHIENMLLILRRKGYYGINLTYQFITEDNRQIYENYTKKVVMRLRQEGYAVFVTISENFIISADRLLFNKIDYSEIGNIADGVTVLNYNWGYSFGPPGPVTSVYLMKEFLDYIITLIPNNKVDIGIPIIGYDWELPYTIGVNRANSLTLSSSISLAYEVDASITFDEVSQTPYFRYVDERGGIPKRHIVWFIDARTINAVTDLIMTYKARGTGIWNIMNYYPQMWLVINTQYEIETILTEI
jgi:Predicted glycosyl hydrolase